VPLFFSQSPFTYTTPTLRVVRYLFWLTDQKTDTCTEQEVGEGPRAPAWKSQVSGILPSRSHCLFSIWSCLKLSLVARVHREVMPWLHRWERCE
jgi:hypothetical protein